MSTKPKTEGAHAASTESASTQTGSERSQEQKQSSSHAARPASPSEIRKQVDVLREDAVELVDISRHTAEALTEEVRSRLERNPYVVLAAAAGLGFVLGGGLTPRALGTLASAGLRLGTAYLFRTALVPGAFNQMFGQPEVR